MRIPPACGYASTVLVDRMIQYLVAAGLPRYAAAVVPRRKGRACFPPPGAKIDCGAATIQVGTGRVMITLRQWLANQLGFSLHWGLCLLAILLVKRRRVAVPAVLLYGVVGDSLFRDGSDRSFVDYCRSAALTPLRDPKCLIVEHTAREAPLSSGALVYARRPLLTLLRTARLGFLGRFRLVAGHLVGFITCWVAAVRTPLLSVLGRDLAYASITFALDRARVIEAVVLTCSSYASQPLWMRAVSAKVHMIWYSQNWRTVAYAQDKLRSDVPNMRWIRADTHWVWTHAFADYLHRLGHPGTVEVVDPILWYLPLNRNRSASALEVAIFDVPAIEDGVMLEVCGEITNFFHPRNLRQFIEDILATKAAIETSLHRPVSFRLKTKGRTHAHYDNAYSTYLGELAAKGVLSLEHPSTNIFAVISASHLAIVYPFSSPAYIGDFLKVPCIFHDPTGSICHDDFRDADSLIRFTDSATKLLDAMLATLRSAVSATVYADSPAANAALAGGLPQ